MILPLFLAAAISRGNGCIAIEHNRILGADLRQAVPAWNILPADADFGAAPVPGNVRVFALGELKRIAAEHRLIADVSNEVCFVWATKPLSDDALVAAMKASLAPRPVKIEILDRSRWPAPAGPISFPRTSFSLSAAGVTLWRGYVTYGSNLRFDIWVRARVTVQEDHLVTTENLNAGHTLSAGQFRIEPYDGPLTREEPFTAAADVIGQAVKFDLPSGTLLTRRLLEAPHDVLRGDTLTVLSENGHAHVEAECIAEESGRAGDVITVHNARTSRRLHVLIQSKGKALVVSGDALGLMTEEQNR